MKDLIMPSVFLGMLIAAVTAFATFSGDLSERTGSHLNMAETSSIALPNLQ